MHRSARSSAPGRWRAARRLRQRFRQISSLTAHAQFLRPVQSAREFETGHHASGRSRIRPIGHTINEMFNPPLRAVPARPGFMPVYIYAQTEVSHISYDFEWGEVGLYRPERCTGGCSHRRENRHGQKILREIGETMMPTEKTTRKLNRRNRHGGDRRRSRRRGHRRARRRLQPRRREARFLLSGAAA